MITVEEARNIIYKKISPLGEEKISSLHASLRVLFSDILVRENSPFFDQSAMDGYAISSRDLDFESDFSIAFEVPAGSTRNFSLPKKTVARIFTGAWIPDGADTVVPQEDVIVKEGKKIQLLKARPFQFVRKTAEDLKEGELLYPRGTLLDSRKIAVLASQGISKVSVAVLPDVGFILSGDELVQGNQSIRPGQVRSCNGEIFSAVLSSFCKQIKNYGVSKDNKKDLTNRLLRAKEKDLILISAGSSVGDYDFTKEVLLEIGYEIHFSKVAIRPGKPLIFATKENQALFGVPGNPVSTWVSTRLFIMDAVCAFLGLQRKKQRILARMTHEMDKPQGLEVYVRGNLSFEGREMKVSTRQNQSSGALGALSMSDCLVCLDSEKEKILAGELVEVIPAGTDDIFWN